MAGSMTKVSKTEARYQDHPKALQQCSACSMFVKPDGCTKVEGDILPRGWCRYFWRRRSESKAA